MLLEVGLAASVAVLATGIGLLLAGRARGGARRGVRAAEGAPAAGGVPAERHQNTSSVSAR